MQRVSVEGEVKKKLGYLDFIEFLVGSIRSTPITDGEQKNKVFTYFIFLPNFRFFFYSH